MLLTWGRVADMASGLAKVLALSPLASGAIVATLVAPGERVFVHARRVPD